MRFTVYGIRRVPYALFTFFNYPASLKPTHTHQPDGVLICLSVYHYPIPPFLHKSETETVAARNR